VDFFRKVRVEYSGYMKLFLLLNRWDSFGTFGHSCRFMGSIDHLIPFLLGALDPCLGTH
jgi:hypothetical protein